VTLQNVTPGTRGNFSDTSALQECEIYPSGEWRRVSIYDCWFM